MNAIPVAGTLSRRTACEDETAVPLQPHGKAPQVVISSAIDPSDAFAAHWDALARDAAEPNAFGERWFVVPGLAALPPPAGSRFLAVWADACLIGHLILAPGRRYARLPIAHVENWMNYHCFLGTPLVRRGEEQRFWTAVLAALDEDREAGHLLHLKGLVEDGPVHAGLVAACAAHRRPCDRVHRATRALLDSDLAPEAYLEKTVRKKKRKEFNRLSNRLHEEGTVRFHRLEDPAALAAWCDAFLALEASGWKGEAGSSLGSQAHTEHFFREIASGALAAGRLELLRLDLDDKPIAMLVNFLTPPGAFSFKIAFDEDHARFSPGVMIQLENLNILNRADIAWMDSCAVEDHPMINSLWGERRPIVRVTVPIGGWRGRLTFRLCRALENASARRRARTSSPATESPQ